jgi:hypothetical protein
MVNGASAVLSLYTNSECIVESSPLAVTGMTRRQSINSFFKTTCLTSPLKSQFEHDADFRKCTLWPGIRVGFDDDKVHIGRKMWTARRGLIGLAKRWPPREFAGKTGPP